VVPDPAERKPSFASEPSRAANRRCQGVENFDAQRMPGGSAIDCGGAVAAAVGPLAHPMGGIALGTLMKDDKSRARPILARPMASAPPKLHTSRGPPTIGRASAAGRLEGVLAIAESTGRRRIHCRRRRGAGFDRAWGLTRTICARSVSSADAEDGPAPNPAAASRVAAIAIRHRNDRRPEVNSAENGMLGFAIDQGNHSDMWRSEEATKSFMPTRAPEPGLLAGRRDRSGH
jgi:hypothetical protein